MPYGKALDLDGTNQYATVPLPAGSAVGSPLTVEAWVYVRSYANWSRLIDFGNGAGSNNIACALSSGTSGQPALYFFNESGGITGSVTSPTALPLNTWTHLAFTHDGTTGSILINGKVAISGPMPATTGTLRTDNFIGRSNFGIDDYANAIIDEFRIWSVARSPAQILASQGAPLVGDEAGLLLYYKFDNASGTVATNSATATGAPWNGTIPAPTQFTPGTRSVGDPYLPTLGNGGYDVQHYDLTINYNPVANTMVSEADLTIRATKGLSEFSLDLRGFPGATAKIDGIPAGVARVGDKLIITPASGIVSDRVFHAVVDYSGTPAKIIDADGAPEGWVPIDSGAWVVCEPMGSIGWFPNNCTPADKATYDFHITAPATHTALGNGELTSKVNNGNGTATWNWHMGYPMASYLATATVALFDYTKSVSDTAVGASGNPLEIYNAFESALSPAEKAGLTADAAIQDDIIKFIADEIGTYPFDSTGVVLYRIPELDYALEVQTKSHFTWLPMDREVLAHELTHQWFGDSVSPATWREVWINEGFATWWEWYWDNQRNGDTTTVEDWFDIYYHAPEQTWDAPSANLPNASLMFDFFTMYSRPAMMLEAYRQIAGPPAFFALQRSILAEHGYGNITTAQFIALAKRIAKENSSFGPAHLAQLDEFFQQWLYEAGRPTLTPATFFQDLQPRLAIRLLNVSDVELTWSPTIAGWSLEETDDLRSDSWTPVLSSPVVTNGETKVTLARQPAAHFFRLRSN
ncbi:LamG-like jellyroll fold domain-containing protein [Luteolibacter soli]|uniref:Aminopeptidase N n=1 Tax=Luteolibacter soli TaxID=3135280 RepID=A0ABU9B1K4_9BACT